MAHDGADSSLVDITTMQLQPFLLSEATALNSQHEDLIRQAISQIEESLKTLDRKETAEYAQEIFRICNTLELDCKALLCFLFQRKAEMEMEDVITAHKARLEAIGNDCSTHLAEFQAAFTTLQKQAKAEESAKAKKILQDQIRDAQKEMMEVMKNKNSLEEKMKLLQAAMKDSSSSDEENGAAAAAAAGGGGGAAVPPPPASPPPASTLGAPPASALGAPRGGGAAAVPPPPASTLGAPPAFTLGAPRGAVYGGRGRGARSRGGGVGGDARAWSTFGAPDLLSAPALPSAPAFGGAAALPSASAFGAAAPAFGGGSGLRIYLQPENYLEEQRKHDRQYVTRTSTALKDDNGMEEKGMQENGQQKKPKIKSRSEEDVPEVADVTDLTGGGGAALSGRSNSVKMTLQFSVEEKLGGMVNSIAQQAEISDPTTLKVLSILTSFDFTNKSHIKQMQGTITSDSTQAEKETIETMIDLATIWTQKESNIFMKLTNGLHQVRDCNSENIKSSVKGKSESIKKEGKTFVKQVKPLLDKLMKHLPGFYPPGLIVEHERAIVEIEDIQNGPNAAEQGEIKSILDKTPTEPAYTVYHRSGPAGVLWSLCIFSSLIGDNSMQEEFERRYPGLSEMIGPDALFQAKWKKAQKTNKNSYLANRWQASPKAFDNKAFLVIFNDGAGKRKELIYMNPVQDRKRRVVAEPEGAPEGKRTGEVGAQPSTQGRVIAQPSTRAPSTRARRD